MDLKMLQINGADCHIDHPTKRRRSLPPHCFSANLQIYNRLQSTYPLHLCDSHDFRSHFHCPDTPSFG